MVETNLHNRTATTSNRFMKLSCGLFRVSEKKSSKNFGFLDLRLKGQHLDQTIFPHSENTFLPTIYIVIVIHLYYPYILYLGESNVFYSRHCAA